MGGYFTVDSADEHTFKVSRWTAMNKAGLLSSTVLKKIPYCWANPGDQDLKPYKANI